VILRAAPFEPHPEDAPLHARAERLQRLAITVSRSHRLEARITGKLPRGPAVLVANHLSYIDVPLLLGLAPCVPISKKEIARWPIVGGIARSFEVLFVDRADPWSGALALRRAVRLLERGVSVLGFPEGTTTDGEILLQFRRGLFGAARLAGVPVVPIAIRYADRSVHWIGEQLFLPHYLKTLMRGETRAEVTIGSPIDPHADAGAVAQQARATIQRMLRRSP
jgi:lyso-ornithine lipid O-acyltransferase